MRATVLVRMLRPFCSTLGSKCRPNSSLYSRPSKHINLSPQIVKPTEAASLLQSAMVASLIYRRILCRDWGKLVRTMSSHCALFVLLLPQPQSSKTAAQPTPARLHCVARATSSQSLQILVPTFTYVKRLCWSLAPIAPSLHYSPARKAIAS